MRRPASRACVSRARARAYAYAYTPSYVPLHLEVCVSPSPPPHPPSPLPGTPRNPTLHTRNPTSQALLPQLARSPRLNTCQHVGWHRFFVEIENPKNKTSEAWARMRAPIDSAPSHLRPRRRMRGGGGKARNGEQWGWRLGRQEISLSLPKPVCTSSGRGEPVPCSPSPVPRSSESEVLQAHLTPGGIASLHCRIRSQEHRCVTFPLN